MARPVAPSPLRWDAASLPPAARPAAGELRADHAPLVARDVWRARAPCTLPGDALLACCRVTGAREGALRFGKGIRRDKERTGQVACALPRCGVSSWLIPFLPRGLD
jgi:hypothetical protein